MLKPRFVIKPKQLLGKYRIECKLGDGGSAAVYRAFDTIEGVRVALKVPYEHLLTDEWMEDFRREIRINAQLKHPNILPVKTADLVEGRPVVAYPLGERTLGDRLRSRMWLPTAMGFMEQLLDAVAFAHDRKVIHCDIKPENLILFPDSVLMLSDFGLAKVTFRTLRASGSGTVGYVAPEQAMGRPSFRSDVFSSGLIFYRMLSGTLPEWPYHWPPPGYERLRAKAHPELIEFLRRSIEVDPKRRYRNAIVMFMSVELMLNAANLAFVTFARINGNLEGQMVAFFVMVVAACEVVVGLAIIVMIYRSRRSASVDDVNLLRR